MNREGDGWSGAHRRPADCLAKFKSNRLFGWLMLAGMALAGI